MRQVTYPKRAIWEALPSLEERIETGRSQRSVIPREAHATPTPQEGRNDPIQLLIESGAGRLEELVPIRYGRMVTSPLAFLRGAAVVMAEDLSRVPDSGIFVQCCGDCHLMNFGGYATPERNQVFDINDFDETHPAPFEWDVKRLAASVVVAGRHLEFSEKDNKKAALFAVQTYAEKMRDFSSMRQLELWYNRLDEASVIAMFRKDKRLVKRVKEISSKARERSHDFVFPRISEMREGARKIIDERPLIYHPANSDQLIASAYDFFEDYFDSMSGDKKSLLQRYRLADVALKVVGVGSVGTRCFIGLFTVNDDDAMILQFKEGRPSVLEKYTGQSTYENHGARIVNGQRLMQTVSDIFLGWTKSKQGQDFYVRQLRDMKASANIDNFSPRTLKEYASLCGWALAKSHAKAGSAPEITGYIGKSTVFAEAVADYAVHYANQTESDYALLKEAEKNKRIKVLRGK